MAYSLTEALMAVLSSARVASSESASLTTETNSGVVQSTRIIAYSNMIVNLWAQMAALEVVSGVLAFASTQTNKTITAAMFTSYKNSLSATCDWIGAAITGPALYTYNSVTKQIVPATFTTAQTAGLRTQLASLKAAADALIP